MATSIEEDEVDHAETIDRLESALADEKAKSARLREALESLEKQVESLIDARLKGALERAEKAEKRLAEQTERLEALGSGREESMVALNEVRDELHLITAERDQLRRQLTAVEGMQVETLVCDEGDYDGDIPPDVDGYPAARTERSESPDALPSIEELMADISGEGKDAAAEEGFGQSKVDDDTRPDEQDWKEMIPPEMIVSGSKKKAGTGGLFSGPSPRRLIMIVDGQESIEFPLDEPLMTIGRSESADIKIDGNFISRIHSRILMLGADVIIEDAGSKNGTKVNSETVDRATLSPGDIIRVGSVEFKFVDNSRPG